MIQPTGIEETIKNSSLVKKSEADALRIANIITKAEKGETPIADTLEFMADKLDDKKRNVIIAIGAFAASVLAYKSIGKSVMPYAKKAVKSFLEMIPEKGPKYIEKISKFINKELKDIKITQKVSNFLSKANINKVGDVMEWGGAGLAAILLGKGLNKAGDKVDDAIDIKRMEEKEA